VIRRLLKIAVVLAILGFVSPVRAQTPPAGTPHSVVLTWTAPSPVGGSGTVAGYNVYKSLSGAAFVKVNTAIIPLLSFTDTSVLSGQSLSYCATTVDTLSEESACSVSAPATIPSNPNPPTLKITSIAINNVNGQDRLQVDWTDSNGAATSVNIFGGQGQNLKQVSQTTANGVYSYAVLIPVQSGSVSICDAQGCVTQAFAGI
jgi:hypothetical protein